MKFTYQLTDDEGNVSNVAAMSFKKMLKKIDNKKSYNVIYKNKKGNLQNKRIINGKVIYKRQT